MIRHVNLLIVLLATTNVFFVSAQNSTVTTGGSANGSGGSVTYSVGQVFYSTNNGSTGTLIQGVQQPYEISVMTAINNIPEISLNCSVFPNPTFGKIKLIIDTDTLKNLRFQLFNLYGNLLQDKKIENEETEIIMDSYSSSTYFLKVLSGKREIKTFKIIKH